MERSEELSKWVAKVVLIMKQTQNCIESRDMCVITVYDIQHFRSRIANFCRITWYNTTSLAPGPSLEHAYLFCKTNSTESSIKWKLTICFEKILEPFLFLWCLFHLNRVHSTAFFANMVRKCSFMFCSWQVTFEEWERGMLWTRTGSLLLTMPATFFQA